jgi:hypothetical protein
VRGWETVSVWLGSAAVPLQPVWSPFLSPPPPLPSAIGTDTLARYPRFHLCWDADRVLHMLGVTSGTCWPAYGRIFVNPPSGCFLWALAPPPPLEMLLRSTGSSSVPACAFSRSFCARRLHGVIAGCQCMNRRYNSTAEVPAVRRLHGWTGRLVRGPTEVRLATLASVLPLTQSPCEE